MLLETSAPQLTNCFLLLVFCHLGTSARHCSGLIDFGQLFNLFSFLALVKCQFNDCCVWNLRCNLCIETIYGNQLCAISSPTFWFSPGLKFVTTLFFGAPALYRQMHFFMCASTSLPVCMLECIQKGYSHFLFSLSSKEKMVNIQNWGRRAKTNYLRGTGVVVMAKNNDSVLMTLF